MSHDPLLDDLLAAGLDEEDSERLLEYVQRQKDQEDEIEELDRMSQAKWLEKVVYGFLSGISYPFTFLDELADRLVDTLIFWLRNE